MIYALERNVHRHAVHIDSPKPHYGDIIEEITISGWAIPSVVSVLISSDTETVEVDRTVSRPDVTASLRGKGIHCTHDVHGFSVSCPVGNYEIYGVDAAGERTLQCSVLFSSDETVALGVGKWLFLTDSNKLKEQAEGAINGAPIIAVWDDYLDKISELSDKLGFKWCFSIAPSKELIVPELSPFDVSENNLLNQFVRRSRYKNKLICSIDELKATSSISYWPGDTHWSSVGGAIASRNVLAHYGIENDIEPLKPIEINMQPGDLGIKLRGLFEAPYAHVAYRKAVRKIFSAYPSGGNTGQLTIFESDEKAAQGTLLVSGGSSFNYMSKFLAPWFKRTYFIHATGRMDPSIIEELKPSHILLQNNSRFMISHRDNGSFCSLSDLIDVTKMAEGNISGVKVYDDTVADLRRNDV